MKLFKDSSLYIVSGHLKSPKPSKMSSNLSTNINYIIHTIFVNIEENIVHFYYINFIKISSYTCFIRTVTLDM